MTHVNEAETAIVFDQWERILRKGAASFGLILTDQQVEHFYDHAVALLQWSKKINLTAIKDPKSVAIKHFVDSLGPASFAIPMQHVLDVGSGGGFPGLPLKVWNPSLDLTLIDAVRKKISFIQHVIRILKLTGTQAIHGRIEDLARQDGFRPFDTILCRAFRDLSFIVTHGLPLLAKNGKIIVWKGKLPEEEIEAVRFQFQNEHGGLAIETKPYRLPILDAERTIVIITAHRGN
jgi:16S rRNA (guanine527-N7)-methyltransferase